MAQVIPRNRRRTDLWLPKCRGGMDWKSGVVDANDYTQDG